MEKAGRLAGPRDGEIVYDHGPRSGVLVLAKMQICLTLFLAAIPLVPPAKIKSLNDFIAGGEKQRSFVPPDEQFSTDKESVKPPASRTKGGELVSKRLRLNPRFCVARHHLQTQRNSWPEL